MSKYKIQETITYIFLTAWSLGILIIMITN